jgi:hypothetical protein
MSVEIKDNREMTIIFEGVEPINTTLAELQSLYDKIGKVQGIVRHRDTQGLFTVPNQYYKGDDYAPKTIPRTSPIPPNTPYRAVY